MRETIFKFAVPRRNLRERGCQWLLCWTLSLKNDFIVTLAHDAFIFSCPPKYVGPAGAEGPSAHFYPSCPTQSTSITRNGQGSPLNETSETSSHPYPSLSTLSPSSHALSSTPSQTHQQPARPCLCPFLSPTLHGPHPDTRVPALSLTPAHRSPSPSCSQVPSTWSLGKHRSPSYKPAPYLPTHS